VIALGVVAAQASQLVKLRFGLDTLGYNADAKRGGQRHDGGHDRGGLGPVQERAHELPVDLQ
jgi:hypothetical protein